MCPQSAYPLLMPFFFDVTSCELLHESTIRQFTHGQGHGQDVTSQGSLGVYVKALSRSMCLAKNSKQSHLVSLKQWEYNLSSKPRFMHAVVNTIYAIAYRRLKSSSTGFETCFRIFCLMCCKSTTLPWIGRHCGNIRGILAQAIVNKNAEVSKTQYR